MMTMMMMMMTMIEGAIEKCMQLAPAFNLLNMLPTNDYTRGTPFDNIQFSNLENLVSLWRTKRDTGLVNVDEDDFIEFLGDLGDYKADMASKMGNLTCVLTELKLLTPEMKVGEGFCNQHSSDWFLGQH